VAEKQEKAPAKRTKSGDPNRGSNGRFLPGNNANPRGRAPLPPDFKDYAKEAPARLRAICDDPATPVKVRADIERWFAEMWYGKSPQALDIDGSLENNGKTVIEFKGAIAEWAK
jgi:hypothetical protein